MTRMFDFSQECEFLKIGWTVKLTAHENCSIYGKYFSLSKHSDCIY